MSYSINRYNNFLDPFFDAIFTDGFEAEQYGTLSMKTDIKEAADHYEMSVELPGVKKENIEISYKDGYLTIKANANTAIKKEEKVNFLHRERFSGAASREYYVGEIDEKAINATYADGVLFISFPKEKPEEKKSHNIAIS